MKEISLEELKKIELNLLKQFRDICEKEGFCYSLWAGTLLGAVRHGGFIPWDDDVDVCMPLPDYKRFIEYCKNNKTKFKLVSKETTPGYGYMFGKICDPNTIIEEEHTNASNINMGVYVDIFPIYGLGHSLKAAKVRFLIGALVNYLLVAKNWKHFFRNENHSAFRELIRYLFYKISRVLSMKKLINLIDFIFCSDTEYYENSSIVASITQGLNFNFIYDKSDFCEFAKTDFEKEKFSAVKNFDYFLKSFYGNYMKLPPIEEQIAHHSFKAFNRNSLSDSGEIL